ncbi:hypothetical protein J4558_18070 [Leptolyngbya sp. 15MV]|nr:hypothetical protein J4558_18070 [Leptolyngbya sp. 15MV]
MRRGGHAALVAKVEAEGRDPFADRRPPAARTRRDMPSGGHQRLREAGTDPATRPENCRVPFHVDFVFLSRARIGKRIRTAAACPSCRFD